jgi:hypothetical protein
MLYHGESTLNARKLRLQGRKNTRGRRFSSFTLYDLTLIITSWRESTVIMKTSETELLHTWIFVSKEKAASGDQVKERGGKVGIFDFRTSTRGRTCVSHVYGLCQKLQSLRHWRRARPIADFPRCFSPRSVCYGVCANVKVDRPPTRESKARNASHFFEKSGCPAFCKAGF